MGARQARIMSSEENCRATKEAVSQKHGERSKNLIITGGNSGIPCLCDIVMIRKAFLLDSRGENQVKRRKAQGSENPIRSDGVLRGHQALSAGSPNRQSVPDCGPIGLKHGHSPCAAPHRWDCASGMCRYGPRCTAFLAFLPGPSAEFRQHYLGISTTVLVSLMHDSNMYV